MMFAVLSQYTNSFKYTPLGQSRLQPHTFRFLNSKRRAVLATGVLLVLFVLASFYWATPGIRRRRQIAGSQDWSAASLPERVSDAVDWSHFAYVQYATNKPYLCNSIMLFEALHRLGSRADRLLLYPSKFAVSPDGTDPQSWESGLLRKARDEYNVKLKPIEVVARGSNDPTWAESYTKLLAFNQTQYARVLHLDSDATVLQTMDELFLLPPVPLAIPRAYWLNASDRVMSSQLLLIQPSDFEYARISKAIDAAGPNEYDMDIITNLYRDNALILPHRPYNMLTGEYRNVGSHKAYMGSEEEPFDPETALKEVKYIHFSDWPMPKPWITASSDVRQEKMPPCIEVPKTNSTDCRQQKTWLGFYDDFARRRADICNITVSASNKRRWVKRALDLDPTYEPYFE